MIPYSTDFFLFHYILSLALTSLTSVIFSVFILITNAKSKINRLYAIFAMSIAWWSGTQALIGTWPDPSIWLRIVQIEHIGHVWIPSFFLHFTHGLIGLKRPKRLMISYGISMLFLCLIPTHVFIKGVDTTAVAKFAVEAGPIYPIYLLWFVGTIIECVAKIRTAIVSCQQLHDQLSFQYMFWASLIGYVGGLPNFLYVFNIDVYPLNPFSTYLVPVYIVLVAYAAFKHQLLDITIVIKRSLVYSILVTLLTIGYFGVIYGAERTFRTAIGYQSFWLSLAAFALMAFTFQPLKIGIQRFVDRLFFQAPYEELAKRMERLEQETQQTEKLKAVATLAAGMAHEIKNPLSSIKTFAEYLPDKYDDPHFREKFSRIINQEVGKINALVQRLLDFAKPTEPVKRPVQVTQLLGETIELLHGQLLNKHIAVACSYTFDDTVLADAGQLRQAFLNVLLNSIEALKDRGQIRVATISKNSHVEIIVEDTGPGIPQKDLLRIFDPFYTTKPNGTGLGLSVVHSIIQEHGGIVTVDSGKDRGTTVRIQLPLN